MRSLEPTTHIARLSSRARRLGRTSAAVRFFVQVLVRFFVKFSVQVPVRIFARFLAPLLLATTSALAADIVVRDAQGRSVTLSSPARRAITSAPHATEPVYRAGYFRPRALAAT